MAWIPCFGVTWNPEIPKGKHLTWTLPCAKMVLSQGGREMEDEYMMRKENRRKRIEAGKRRMPKHGYGLLNLDITIVTPEEKALRKKVKRQNKGK